MSVDSRTSLDQVRVGDRGQWADGPPHELFKRMREERPVHWSDGITEYPAEAGYWSAHVRSRPFRSLPAPNPDGPARA